MSVEDVLLPKEALRLRCLEIAIGHGLGEPIREAERLFNYIVGLPAKTPRQTVDEALDAAGVR